MKKQIKNLRLNKFSVAKLSNIKAGNPPTYYNACDTAVELTCPSLQAGGTCNTTGEDTNNATGPNCGLTGPGPGGGLNETMAESCNFCY